MELWCEQELKWVIDFKKAKMKYIYSVLVITICLTIVSCYSDDYGSNRYVSLSIKDAIEFENLENYVVGDTIFIDLNFSRYLAEEGYDNLLDIYESSGSETFNYNFAFSKFSELSNGFRSIAIDPNFIVVEKGNVGEYSGASALLNADQSAYESRIGLILAEAGRFRFDYDFFYIQSDSFSNDHVQIEIEHSFTGTPPNFEFTVTE